MKTYKVIVNQEFVITANSESDVKALVAEHYAIEPTQTEVDGSIEEVEGAFEISELSGGELNQWLVDVKGEKI